MNEQQFPFKKETLDEMRKIVRRQLTITSTSVKSIKPDRNFPINQDDINNLRIAFSTAKTMEEFLRLV